MQIDGKILAKMIICAADELNKNRVYVDELNVFPVPDGDTGTNMSLTVLSAKKEIENLNSCDVSEIAERAAVGALKGARGNSGVIVSQLFRGFSKAIEHLKVASGRDLILACKKASEMAYKAVMKPKEGTILTMSKEIANKFEEAMNKTPDLREALFETIVYCKKILDQTKDMLPELKQAGVVDSGARGLLFLFEGALRALDKNIIFDFEDIRDKVKDSPAQANFVSDEIKFDYEVLLDVNDLDEEKLSVFKDFLLKIGDSLVVTNGDEFIRIHVHTDKPGKIIDKAVEFCDVFNARFENLKTQHENIVKSLVPEKNIGILAVAMGNGFLDLFKNLGADEVIDGGKLMNPSAQDIIDMVKRINAKRIIILPNSKNIFMAANQAAELYKDKKIIILPTESIPQGLNALLNYIPRDIVVNGEINFEEQIKNDQQMLEKMREAINLVKTGQITYAARDTEINKIKVKRGDYLGTIEKELVVCEKDLDVAVKNLIDLLLKNGGEILSLYYGEEISLEKAKEILEYVNKKYKDIEAEIYNGGQPMYYYLISVE